MVAMKNMSARLARIEAKSPAFARAREYAEAEARAEAFLRRLESEDRRFFREMAHKQRTSGKGLTSFTDDELHRLREMYQRHREPGGMR